MKASGSRGSELAVAITMQLWLLLQKPKKIYRNIDVSRQG